MSQTAPTFHLDRDAVLGAEVFLAAMLVAVATLGGGVEYAVMAVLLDTVDDSEKRVQREEMGGE